MALLVRHPAAAAEGGWRGSSTAVTVSVQNAAKREQVVRSHSVTGAQAPSLAWLLRTWRVEVVAMRAAAAAASLVRLDAPYGASGALIDMASALGTPSCLDPRHIWWHNFAV
jgi:hypothetical protein